MKYITWSNAGTTWRAAYIKRSTGANPDSMSELCCERLQEDMLKQKVWVPCSEPALSTIVPAVMDGNVGILGTD